MTNPLHHFVMGKKEDYLVRELPESCEVFTDFFVKTLLVDEIIKKGPEEENRFFNYMKDMKQKHSLEISNKHLDSDKKYNEPETSDDQTSVGSEAVSRMILTQEHHQEVKLSQFVDKQDERTLWSHEESFRRKTRNVINTMLEKQRKEKELALPLLSSMGAHVSRTGAAVIDLEKKIGKTLLGTTGTHVTGSQVTPATSNGVGIPQKPQTAFGALLSQHRGQSGKKPGKAHKEQEH